MKTLFFKLTLILFSFVSIINAQEKFVLEAELSGFEDSTLFHISASLSDMTDDMENTYSIFIVNGKFKFEKYLDRPTMFSLRAMPKIPPDNPLDYEFVSFWAENKPMTLKGEKGTLIFADIKGSVFQDQYYEMISNIRKLLEEHKILSDAFITGNLGGESIESFARKGNNNTKAIDEKQIEFALNHPAYLCSEATLVLFINRLPERLDKNEIAKFYNKLTTDFKNNIYGKQIKEFISNEEELYPLLGIGDDPYQFLLPDSANTMITLAEFEGKYVLLDFWASGCGPCRAEHKNYFENYQKYKSKGFEIVSVSQDQSKKLWKKATEKDNMIWKSVWDEDRLVTKMYTIRAIPSNFLIDREGKIIAKNLRGAELSKKLAELF